MSNELDNWQWVDEDPFEKVAWGSQPAPPALPTPNPADIAYNSLSGFSAAPDRFRAEFDTGCELESQNNWDAAADSFRRAHEIEPGRADVLLRLGTCLLHLDSRAEACDCFDDCLLAGVERERALFGKAVALQKLGRNAEADRLYRELLQMNPNAVEPLANLIALSVAQQDATAVGEYSRQLLRIDPYSKAALQGLATVAIWNGDQSAAIEYCNRVLEVDPVSFEGWANLGFAKGNMHPKKALRSIA